MHIYTYRRIVIERVVREKKDLTRKVKPVTEANEVATAAAERGREPRCPTNITDIT